MEGERARRVEAIVNEALAREGEARAAYLETACGGDAEVRREVESLLRGAAGGPDLLEPLGWVSAGAALAPGTRLGPYEIQAAIGAGGMGEVYQARDTRLGRTVAIKVLPPDLASDPERRRRFEHEARAASALNHPHICTLYDLGDADLPDPGSRVPDPARVSFLVLEYLDGQTLADRLAKGPLPVAQALELGAQIAEALGAAHRQGIVHRDLKPANVMLTKASTPNGSGVHVKLLDFGLAKLRAHGEQPLVASTAAGPSASASLTARGEILGTWPYMAPEQVEGKPADVRTDIWALGAVLYEMFTGARAFVGDTAASVVGAILERDPEPLSSRRQDTPPALDRLVRKCLAKDPDARWQDARDVADELRWIAQGGVNSVLGHTPRKARWRLTTRAIAALALVGLLVVLMILLRPHGPVPEVRYFTVGIDPAVGLLGGLTRWGDEVHARVHQNRPNRTALALTPDGRRLVFVGYDGQHTQLYVRDVWGREEARPLDGTRGADAPFVSPDGRWVGYWVPGAAGDAGPVLMKLPLDEGGPAAKLCAARGVAGASWSDDDAIVFADPGRGGLWRVPIDGGTPMQLVVPAPDDHRLAHPHVLPGSRVVLFTAIRGLWNWEQASVMLYDIASGTSTELIRGAADARYVPPGHLVYFRRGQLVAVAFDRDTLQVTGQERALANDVMQSTNGVNSSTDSGDAQVALSASGTLAYISGGEVPDVNRGVVWVDHQGRVEPLQTPSKPYYAVRLSPDGRRVVLHTLQSDRRIWVHDLSRPDSLMALTASGIGSSGAIWSPDGQEVAFGQIGTPDAKMFRTRADGSQRQPEPFGPTATGERYSVMGPSSWGRDGQLVYVTFRPGRAHDIWLLSVPGAADSARPLFAESWAEQWPTLSPDGRWLAYGSAETGRDQVFLVRFPSLKNRTPLTNERSTSPVWSRDGRTLYYLQGGPVGGSELVEHDIGPDGEPAARGRVLFRLEPLRLLRNQPITSFDVSLDGQRFLFIQHEDVPLPDPPRQIHIVENWFQELKAKMAAGGR